MRILKPFVLIAACTLVICAPSAIAHHSYAMFDRQTTNTYAAVVRTWEFSNPHAYLWVYINNTEGKPILWGLEAPGPSMLLRQGWDKNTVMPGDKVSVSINPLKAGGNGGNLVTLTLADGRTLGTTSQSSSSKSAVSSAN